MADGDIKFIHLRISYMTCIKGPGEMDSSKKSILEKQKQKQQRIKREEQCASHDKSIKIKNKESRKLICALGHQP